MVADEIDNKVNVNYNNSESSSSRSIKNWLSLKTFIRYIKKLSFLDPDSQPISDYDE